MKQKLSDPLTTALYPPPPTHYTRNRNAHNQKGTHVYNNQEPHVRRR